MALPRRIHNETLSERIHLDVWRSVFLLAGAAGRPRILSPPYARPRFFSGRVTGQQPRSLVRPALKKSGGIRHGATA
jgi:hypothetical protein